MNNSYYIAVLKYTDERIVEDMRRLENQDVEQEAPHDSDWLEALQIVRNERELVTNNKLVLNIWPTSEVQESDIYSAAGSPTDETIELVWSGSYPNLSEYPNPNDGYYQFWAGMKDGRGVELRIPLDTSFQRMDPVDSPSRHPEDRLNGVVEAALGHCMDDEEFLRSCAEDQSGEVYTFPDTPDKVFQAMESYICDHLARM